MATSRDVQKLGTPTGGFVVGDGIPPKDPAMAGFVGKRRAVVGAAPNADGTRAERRAWARAQRRSTKAGA